MKKEETVSPTTRVYQSGHYSDYSKPMTAFGRYMRVSDDLYEEGFSGYMKKIRIWKTAKGADYVKQSYEGTAEVTGKKRIWQPDGTLHLNHREQITRLLT